ncbi:WD domain repeat-containing protein 55, partial [Cichlidogyrus casuarinus]
MDYFPNSSEYVVVASTRSAVKVHCIEKDKHTWSNLKAHGRVPITALICIEDNRWATADERGVIK